MSEGFTMEKWEEQEEKKFWIKEFQIMQQNGEYIRHGHSIYEVRRQRARVMGKKKQTKNRKFMCDGYNLSPII